MFLIVLCWPRLKFADLNEPAIHAPMNFSGRAGLTCRAGRHTGDVFRIMKPRIQEDGWKAKQK